MIHPLAGASCQQRPVMRDAVVAGLGISLLPAFFVDGQLANRALVQIDIGIGPKAQSCSSLFRVSAVP
jgi:DNA-binding transcriptional LysR family regulator